MIDLSSIDVSAFPHWLSPGGEVLLINADCMAVLPLLPKVDAVVTDPPYGILNLQNNETLAIRKSPRASGSGKLKNRMINTADFSWDAKAPTQETLDLIFSLSSVQIIWGGNYFPLPPARCVLVWDKKQPWCNFSQVEIAWTSLEWPAQIFSWDKSNIDKVHPTQKPDRLIEWCLGYLPSIGGGGGGIVLDPFAGSFTTAVACIRTGRQCIAIEIDPKYYAIGKRRCEDALAVGTLFDPAALAAPNLFEETQ